MNSLTKAEGADANEFSGKKGMLMNSDIICKRFQAKDFIHEKVDFIFQTTTISYILEIILGTM